LHYGPAAGRYYYYYERWFGAVLGDDLPSDHLSQILYLGHLGNGGHSGLFRHLGSGSLI